jgi:hypothetical protein
MRRWFAVGITGTLFAMLMLALAVPVAADGTLVTQPPGQAGNSVVYVSSPGFVNNGTAVNPVNGNVTCADATCGGALVCNGGLCYSAGAVCAVNGCAVPNYGVCAVVGCGIPNNGVCAVNGCVAPAYGCDVTTCGNLGYTAAGPIVGYAPNGDLIVYDVRGGDYETIGRDTNGRYCETDSTGACIK